MKDLLRLSVCGMWLTGALLVAGPMNAQDQRSPDNTAANRNNPNDRNASRPNADQANNNLSDRQMMQKIRQDVVRDKSLSTYGHNVKIVSEHGKVTLRGPVHSEEEKKAIEEHARKYAGDNVSNEITVSGRSS